MSRSLKVGVREYLALSASAEALSDFVLAAERLRDEGPTGAAVGELADLAQRARGRVEHLRTVRRKVKRNAQIPYRRLEAARREREELELEQES